jgi:non-ribosomal peptide synthetase component F
VRLGPIDLVPAHVRHLQAAAVGRHHPLVRESGARTPAARRGRHVALLARFEQHLQADADAEEGLVLRRRDDRRAQPARIQLAHAVGHGALAGHHDTVGRGDGGRVEVTSTRACGATCSIALATDRRLPMP